jgi:outer membrane protein insertion porin family
MQSLSIRIMREGGLAALLAILLLGGHGPAGAQEIPQTQALRIDSVLVEGNARVSDAAVLATAGLRAGESVTGRDVQRAIQRLMGTGNFESVEVHAVAQTATSVTLQLELEERPLVTGYEFRGLERISPRAVRDTVGLEGDRPLDPSKVVRTERMIRELLAAEGVQVARIDTLHIPGDEPGQIRLAFDVEEGHRLAIADIVFEGNRAFPDAALRSAMSTRPEGFLWFRTGRYDRDRLREDLQVNLPDFYGARGFIDFAVLSDTMIVDPQTGKARVVIEVDEGPQYRLGEFTVEGNRRFPTERLALVYTGQRRSILGLPFGRAGEREEGEVFDRAALRSATQQVQQLYRNEGYLYAQVEPVIERLPGEDGADPVVNVTWSITERQPFYVSQVRIAGNDFTHESVIRDRLFIFPGDIYNEDRVLQSYQAISGLGFFETPLPTPDINPNPETGEVELVFHVEEQRTGSINFGTSFGGYGRAGGLSGFLGYSQPNLFGQAKQAELHAEFGWRNTFRASYTDPNLAGTRNSGSVSLFHMSDRYMPFGGGRSVQTGGSLRFGMPLMDFRWTRAFVGYTLARRSYESADEICDDPTDIFCFPTSTASTVQGGITRETKDHPLFPTVGTRQALTLEQTGGPLGGDGNFQKVTGDLEWWAPVGRIGGTQPGERPIRMTLGLRVRGGSIIGDADRFPFERFFLGGTQFGQQLRGYEEAEITPFGFSPRRGGLPNAQRVGDAYLVTTAEYAVRLTDAISVSTFAEAGNLWRDVSEIDPTRMFRSIGVGAMLQTPFGPLGVDYAYGFDKPEPGWQFHFKLGPGF